MATLSHETAQNSNPLITRFLLLVQQPFLTYGEAVQISYKPNLPIHPKGNAGLVKMFLAISKNYMGMYKDKSWKCPGTDYSSLLVNQFISIDINW